MKTRSFPRGTRVGEVKDERLSGITYLREFPNFGAIQTIPQERVSIKIDPEINATIESIITDPMLCTYSPQRLSEEKFKCLEGYYSIMSQIPMAHFASIQGFDQSVMMKLKRGVQSIGSRIMRKGTIQKS